MEIDYYGASKEFLSKILYDIIVVYEASFFF